MIEDQLALGRVVVQPGAKTPFDFPADDWVYPTVVSHDRREVFIVAILAKEPGSGAFRRLINNITAAGLTPVVVCPVGVIMPAILKRWRYRCAVRGRGFERVDEWRPPAKSKPADAPSPLTSTGCPPSPGNTSNEKESEG